MPIHFSELHFPDRHFQIWAYTVGLRRLLLRSTKGRGYETRIDVYLQDVKALKLPTAMHGLEIKIANGKLRAEIEKGGENFQPESLFLDMSGQDFHGYVVAQTIIHTEDDGQYDDPAPYGPEKW